MDSGTGQTCGQIEGDVIATKEGSEHFGFALYTANTEHNICFRGSAAKPHRWQSVRESGPGAEEEKKTVMEDERGVEG